MRHSVSVLKSFFGWLYEVGDIDRNRWRGSSRLVARTRRIWT
jgi:hypothetical protein